MISIGPYQFEYASYDGFADQLHLRIAGDAGDPVGAGDTKDGDAFLYPDDTSDRVGGLEIENARLRLEEDGEIVVTLPDGSRERAVEAERIVAR
ncbi:MAG: hypothetical protein JW940_19645 [Polyangiaceae bacterium]|nr:hypothetical protein [Polyangiaceae bacterium]